MAVFPFATIAAETGFAEVLRHDELVTEVLVQNPSLEVARLAYEAAKLKAPQQGSFPEPNASYSFAPLSIGSKAHFGHQIELRQELPLSGKLGLKKKISENEVDSMAAELEELRLELAIEASNLFFERFVLVHALEINAHHQELVSNLKKSAEVQYASGRAMQSEVLEAELEHAKLALQKLELESTLRRNTAQLNGLLRRAPQTTLGLPPSTLPSLGPLEAFEVLEEDAKKSRPSLAKLRSQLTAEELSLKLAGRDFWPELMVMAGYNSMWMDPEHRFMTGLSLNLPLQWGARKSGVREGELRRARAASELENALIALRVEIEQRRIECEAATARERLLRDRVLTAARDRVVASRASFESGRTGLMTWLEADLRLHDVELELQTAHANVYRSRISLGRALGKVPKLSGGTKQ